MFGLAYCDICKMFANLVVYQVVRLMVAATKSLLFAVDIAAYSVLYDVN